MKVRAMTWWIDGELVDHQTIDANRDVDLNEIRDEAEVVAESIAADSGQTVQVRLHTIDASPPLFGKVHHVATDILLADPTDNVTHQWEVYP